MRAEERFTPPYPCPHRSKLSAIGRFWYGWHSWIHTLFEKSYCMQMGHVRTPAFDIYLVNDKALLREITETRSAEFPKHRLQHEILCPLLGENILSANGEAWKRQRSMINPSFTHTRLALSFPTMQVATDALLQQIAAQDLTVPVAIDPLMTHVTADIIFRTILSRVLDGAEAIGVLKNFNRYQDLTQRITTCRLYGVPSFLLKRRQHAAAQAVRAALVPIIAERYAAYHERGENQSDILGSLLEARSEAGQPFTLEELCNQVAMLFLAGHETSASGLTWSLYLLARCPHLQEEIAAEVAQHSEDGRITYATLKSLHHTRNLFREALRLYPPVSFFTRAASKPESMRGKAIAPGALFSISPWLMHRHRDYWPAPDQFDPDRFDDPAQQDAIREAFLPFGRGPRVCVGQGFAMQEGVLVIASIAQRFLLRDVAAPEPVSRISTRPRKPIMLRVTRR